MATASILNLSSPFYQSNLQPLLRSKTIIGCFLVLLDYRRLERSLQPSSCPGSSFPRASQVVLVVKHLPPIARVVRDAGSILGSGRSPGGEGYGNRLWFSCLENPMDRGAWWAVVHRFAELDITEVTYGEGNGTSLQYSCLENPMDKEPGRLQSMGSLSVGHD